MATRDLTAAVITELTSGSLSMILFVHTAWTSGDVYFCSRTHDVVWDGQTWIGGGNIVSISDIKESAEHTVSEFTLTLNGVPAGNRALVESNVIRGSAVKIHVGFVDANDAVIADPYLFEGMLDAVTMVGSSQGSSISIKVEDLDADFKRPRIRRYTDVDHQSEFAGDDFFQDMGNIPNDKIYFGKAPPKETRK